MNNFYRVLLDAATACLLASLIFLEARGIGGPAWTAWVAQASSSVGAVSFAYYSEKLKINSAKMLSIACLIITMASAWLII